MSRQKGFPLATTMARQLIAPTLTPGCVAIDATCGNGLDCLFLARKVGPTGRVLAFDIQSRALENTRECLDKAGCSDRVRFFQRCHSRIAEGMEQGTVAAVMFNLGYLPGGDKQIITRAETTITALESALLLLKPNGVMTVVAYPGHPGGGEEAKRVRDWAGNLDRSLWDSVCYETLNGDLIAAAPFVVAVCAASR